MLELIRKRKRNWLDHWLRRNCLLKDALEHGCANHATEGKCFCPPIHRCDVTKPPYLLSGELCTSLLHSNRLFVYTVCCRRGGPCFSVFRTRHTDVVGDSSGRSYVTEQWHNVPPLRTRALEDKVNGKKLRGRRRYQMIDNIMIMDCMKIRKGRMRRG